MVILDSFIWRKDHYAYHVTNVNAMKSICQYGLKPLCGERSRSVGDSIKGIYFTDYFYSVLEWIDLLYKDVSVYDLEVLRFNLRNRKWERLFNYVQEQLLYDKKEKLLYSEVDVDS